MAPRKSDAELYEDNYAKLLRFTRDKLPESERYDLIQECFTVLVAKREQVENDQAFLYGVAKNKLKQYYERRRKALTIAADFVGLNLDPERMSMASLSTSMSIRVARHNDLEQAMSELSLRQYEAFQLRYVEGLTEVEAARALGASVPTLKRELGRARALLQTVLGDEHGEQELREIVQAYVREG